jgi:hypothetical protein
LAPNLNFHHAAKLRQVHRVAGRGEHQRAGLEHVRRRAWVVLRSGGDLGERDVASGLDEATELAVGDRRAVDPEAAHLHAMCRGLLGIVAIGAH